MFNTTTHIKLILSNIVTESDIYNNYSYRLCVNWEIEKKHETHPKKLEFNIDKPETGLKKIDFNTNVSNNEIDDMNNIEAVHPSGDLTNDDYSNIEDYDTQHERANRNNNVYTLVEDKLQLSHQLKDPNKTNDWKTKNSHEDELVVTYDNNAVLRPRIFYLLYIRPNGRGNNHLIFKLSTQKILVTMKYQPVHVPEDAIKTKDETDSFNNKIQFNHFGSDHFTVQDAHSNNNEEDDQPHFNDENNSEDENHDELDSSPQLNGMKPNKIIDQENQILLTVGSSNFTRISVNKHTGITSTSTSLQDLFLQYLHKTIMTILCLQTFLLVSLHEDILRYLYNGISTNVHLLLPILTSLRNEVLQPSLQNKFLQLSLLVSLRNRVLQSSLLMSLRSGILHQSLLTAIQNEFL